MRTAHPEIESNLLRSLRFSPVPSDLTTISNMPPLFPQIPVLWVGHHGFKGKADYIYLLVDLFGFVHVLSWSTIYSALYCTTEYKTKQNHNNYVYISIWRGEGECQKQKLLRPKLSSADPYDRHEEKSKEVQ